MQLIQIIIYFILFVTDIVAGVFSLINSYAGIITIILAVLAINNWRKQSRLDKKLDVIDEFMSYIYEVQYIVNKMRCKNYRYFGTQEDYYKNLQKDFVDRHEQLANHVHILKRLGLDDSKDIWVLVNDYLVHTNRVNRYVLDKFIDPLNTNIRNIDGEGLNEKEFYTEKNHNSLFKYDSSDTYGQDLAKKISTIEKYLNSLC